MVMAFCDANWHFFVAQHQGALFRNLPLPLPLPAMMNSERAGAQEFKSLLRKPKAVRALNKLGVDPQNALDNGNSENSDSSLFKTLIWMNLKKGRE